MIEEANVEIVSSHPFNVSLERFSGPLDLLLHLVYQQEIDIEKVNLKMVTEQYLQIIENASYLDLEIAGDYLVITATLISFKLKSLIPSGESDKVSLEEESGFLEELREKLRRYEIAKNGAENLHSLNQLGCDVFVRRAKEDHTEELVGDSCTRLATLFIGLIRRVGGMNSQYSISPDQIPVVHFMRQTLSWIKIALKSSGGSSKAEYSSWFSFLKSTAKVSKVAPLDFNAILIQLNVCRIKCTTGI